MWRYWVEFMFLSQWIDSYFSSMDIRSTNTRSQLCRFQHYLYCFCTFKFDSVAELCFCQNIIYGIFFFFCNAGNTVYLMSESSSVGWMKNWLAVLFSSFNFTYLSDMFWIWPLPVKQLVLGLNKFPSQTEFYLMIQSALHFFVWHKMCESFKNTVFYLHQISALNGFKRQVWLLCRIMANYAREASYWTSIYPHFSVWSPNVLTKVV